MVRTAKAVSKDPAGMAAPAGPSTENSSTRGRGGGERDAGRYALAKGPLGIVLAGLLLVETVMGLMVKSRLPTAIATFVICAMVLLAFLVFFGFFYVWIRKPPGYLHPPSAFRSDESWLASLKTDLRPSESLLPSPNPKRAPARNEAQTEAGFDTGAAINASLDAPLSADESWVQRTGEMQGGSVTSTLLMELSGHLQGKPDWGYVKVERGSRLAAVETVHLRLAVPGSSAFSMHRLREHGRETGKASRSRRSCQGLHFDRQAAYSLQCDSRGDSHRAGGPDFHGGSHR